MNFEQKIHRLKMLFIGMAMIGLIALFCGYAINTATSEMKTENQTKTMLKQLD